MLLNAKSSILSQHIPGKLNVIADSLSRDFHLSNETITSMLFFMYPNQMPENFQIFPAPEWLSSWLESLLPNRTTTQESPMRQERSNLEHLADGRGFYNNVRYMTHSSQHFQNPVGIKSSMRLRTPQEIMNLAKRLNLPFGDLQLNPPSTMWLRPSGKPTEETQP